MLKIGDQVILNGKEYTITGTIARSFILTREGKQYKATADKMSKIVSQNNRAAEAPKSEIDVRIAYASIWKQDLKRPTNEAECAEWFDNLRNELSPENLFCDGEISRSQASRKEASIRRCWKELENIVGHRVAE
jgi:hypothetical protein